MNKSNVIIAISFKQLADAVEKLPTSEKMKLIKVIWKDRRIGSKDQSSHIPKSKNVVSRYIVEVNVG
jgi:hypothetical protein